MQTQLQGESSVKQQGQRQGCRRFSWKLLLIVTIVVVALAVAAVWILSIVGIIPTVLASILSAIFGLLGILLNIIPLVSSSNKSEPATSPPQVSTTSAPIAQIPPITVQVSLPQSIAQPLPSLPPDRTAYRGILGMPPPTDPRTIQQREKVVNEVYTKLTQPDITAIVLTGIGGVGKSTLAALIYRFAKEQRRAGTGMFQNEPIWLTINDSVTMADLAGSLFEALGKPLPDFSSLSSHSQALALFNALNTVEKARLIVLDQFENLLEWETGHALTDRPGVGEWIDTINSQKCICRVLLTSRPWPQGTREYPPTHMQEYYQGVRQGGSYPSRLG